MNDQFLQVPEPEDGPTWLERNWLWLVIAAIVGLCACVAMASVVIGLIYLPDRVQSTATSLPSTQTPWIIVQTQEIPALTATPFLPPSPIPTLVIPPTPTLVPTITPMPTATLKSTCDPIAISSMIDRPDAMVNGIPVRLQVRDLNTCPRALFYNETGIAQGTNFAIDLPEGWAAISVSVTVEVQREGSAAQQYLNCPIVYTKGPFHGGFGVYEGSFRVVPIEWLQAVLAEIIPIQSVQCGFNVTPVEYTQ